MIRTLFCAALFFASPVRAAELPTAVVAVEPARLAAAGRMMTAMKMNETTNRMIDAMLGQSMSKITDQVMTAMPLQPGVTDSPEFRAIMKRSVDRMMAKMSGNMRTQLPMPIERMTAIYARNFSVAELDDIARFYGSPTGQAMLERMPALSQQTIAETQQLLLPKLLADLPEMQRAMAVEIEAWMKSKPHQKPAS